MIAVVDYGIGNLRSAEKALQSKGGRATLVSEPDVVATAGAVVLPGVGAFGRCAEALQSTGLADAVLEALRRQVPFLGICVGMQLLYEGSEESPGVEGLGVLPGAVRRLPAGVKHPQMQWNRLVVTDATCPLLAGPLLSAPAEPWVYFVHSYAAAVGEHTVASCDYGGPITAMLGRGHLWATQFHPEKSGPVGLAVLANFVALVAGVAGAAA
jgi:glutamine amidotransferase